MKNSDNDLSRCVLRQKRMAIHHRSIKVSIATFVIFSSLFSFYLNTINNIPITIVVLLYAVSFIIVTIFSVRYNSVVYNFALC